MTFDDAVILAKEQYSYTGDIIYQENHPTIGALAVALLESPGGGIVGGTESRLEGWPSGNGPCRCAAVVGLGQAKCARGIATTPAARRFSETIRLPRRYLVPWVVFDGAYAVFLFWLWAVATMTKGQRVVIAVVLGASVVFLFGGALWFVAMRVVVSEGDLTRRVGHRRTRVSIRDIARSRIEDSTESGFDRVVLALRDGSEETV